MFDKPMKIEGLELNGMTGTLLLSVYDYHKAVDGDRTDPPVPREFHGKAVFIVDADSEDNQERLGDLYEEEIENGIDEQKINDEEEKRNGN